MKHINLKCDELLKNAVSPVTKYSGGTGISVRLTDTARDYLHDYSVEGDIRHESPSLYAPETVDGISDEFDVVSANKNLFEYLNLSWSISNCEFAGYLDGVLHAKGFDNLATNPDPISDMNGSVDVYGFHSVRTGYRYTLSCKIEYISKPTDSDLYAVWQGEYGVGPSAYLRYDEATDRYLATLTLSGNGAYTEECRHLSLKLCASEVKISEIQLERGEVFSGYVEHSHGIANVTLPEGNVMYRLESEDYSRFDEVLRDSDGWGLAKRTKRFDLAESDVYAVESDHTEDGITYMDKLSVMTDGLTERGYILSNRFVYASGAEEPATCEYVDGRIILNITTLRLSSPSAFCMWVANHPTCFVIPIPEYTVALDEGTSLALDTLPTYPSVTYVATQSTVRPRLNVRGFFLGSQRLRPCFLTDCLGNVKLPVTRADLVYFPDGSTLTEKLNRRYQHTFGGNTTYNI